MKGAGKDQEGKDHALFPRLSLNEIDQQKGGPRPPPRNKMALYQRVSVPPPLLNTSASSSNQGVVSNERGTFVPFQNSPASVLSPGARCSSSSNDLFSNSTSENSMITAHSSGNLSTIESLLPATPTKYTSSQQACNFPQFQMPKLQNEEVEFNPTFVRTGMCLDYGNNKPFSNKERYFTGTSSSSQLQAAVTKRLEKSSLSDLESEGLARISSLDQSPKLPKISQDYNENLMSFWKAKQMVAAGASLKNFASDHKHSEQSNQIPASSSSRQRSGQPGESSSGKAWGQVDMDMQENTSSCLPREFLTPKDIIRMIGEENFHKIREEIIRQQRIFSQQLFELHRLAKVQNLLSPARKLLDERLRFGKSFGESSSSKELAPKYVPELPLSYGKSRDEIQWPKFAAIDQDQNLPLPSLNIDNSTSFSTHFGSKMEKSAMFPDTKGLIYKPYTRTGPSPSCPPPGGLRLSPYAGCCGPANNATTSTPSWDFFPGMAPYVFLPCGPPMAAMSPTYFAPYGMLVMNPASMSPSSVDYCRHIATIDKEEFTPARINAGEGSLVLKDHGNKKLENRTSPKRRTSSSNDALPLFPAAPGTEQKTQAIKVIARKPSRLAIE